MTVGLPLSTEVGHQLDYYYHYYYYYYCGDAVGPRKSSCAVQEPQVEVKAT